MDRMNRVVGVWAVAMAGLAGCQSGPQTGAPGSPSARAAATEENAVVHSATQAEAAALDSKDPLQGKEVVLYINGLGCPQCATNADVQLRRVRGISNLRTDLSRGTVTAELADGTRPSAYRLKEAVLDAGFTLVKLETR